VERGCRRQATAGTCGAKRPRGPARIPARAGAGGGLMQRRKQDRQLGRRPATTNARRRSSVAAVNRFSRSGPPGVPGPRRCRSGVQDCDAGPGGSSRWLRPRGDTDPGPTRVTASAGSRATRAEAARPGWFGTERRWSFGVRRPRPKAPAGDPRARSYAVLAGPGPVPGTDVGHLLRSHGRVRLQPGDPVGSRSITSGKPRHVFITTHAKGGSVGGGLPRCTRGDVEGLVPGPPVLR